MVSAEEYDKLTPEERAVRDKADREREAKEQAGCGALIYPSHIH
jgi:hypothetical protein